MLFICCYLKISAKGVKLYFVRGGAIQNEVIAGRAPFLETTFSTYFRRFKIKNKRRPFVRACLHSLRRLYSRAARRYF